MPSYLAKVFGTLFYLGYMPFFPGTLASLAAVLVFFALKPFPHAYYFLTVLTVTTGFLVTGKAEKAFKRKDPSCIVIDEAAGMCISLMGMPFHPSIAVCAFVLFRTFDIIKPFPLRNIQKLNGGIGIMGDDLIAGVYTNVILQVFLRFAS